MPDLRGKAAIVTGANTGIGYETAKALYEKGAQVTIAARDAQKAASAKEKIERETNGSGTLETGILNLANLTQVKAFAERWKETHSRLDLLINNAGVMIPPASKTDDGFELQFGVNVLGHFALTAQLFPLLQATPTARVVTLSSGAAIRATGIDFHNLKLEKDYDEWREYAISKLGNILFAYEFARKLEANGCTIMSVAAHPGVTRTDLQRHIPAQQLEGLFQQFPESMQPWQGALPTLYAATDAAVENGRFYGPDGDKEYAGYPTLSKHSTPAMNNKALAQQLWQYAEGATGTTLL
jgi:NAD(P)-dependent dehydrogenase (short-subunit alcohol dehydrogenase family)